jgi:hypothetical protein
MSSSSVSPPQFCNNNPTDCEHYSPGTFISEALYPPKRSVCLVQCQQPHRFFPVFPNTLGVLVANHLINNTHSEGCAPVIRAVVRDLKKYMHLRHQAGGQRLLPIGFGAAEYEGDRKILNYLTTGGKDSNVDFWTVCIY